MANSRTQSEAIQRAQKTRPTEPMATIMDNLFPVELTSARCAPLINTATELFVEHWNGAAGEEISVPTHNSLELVTGVCQEWQANIRQADASATHTAELQDHVAALEERISNPIKEQPAGGQTTNPRPTPGGMVAPTPDPTRNASQYLRTLKWLTGLCGRRCW